MMNLKKGDLDKIQQALTSAYKTREKIEVGDAWENRVMVRIRGLGPLTSRFDFTALFERYVWRFAPAAALALLVLGETPDRGNDGDVVGFLPPGISSKGAARRQNRRLRDRR